MSLNDIFLVLCATRPFLLLAFEAKKVSIPRYSVHLTTSDYAVWHRSGS